MMNTGLCVRNLFFTGLLYKYPRCRFEFVEFSGNQVFNGFTCDHVPQLLYKEDVQGSIHTMRKVLEDAKPHDKMLESSLVWCDDHITEISKAQSACTEGE
jgi:hypothetical protein